MDIPWSPIALAYPMVTWPRALACPQPTPSTIPGHPTPSSSHLSPRHVPWSLLAVRRAVVIVMECVVVTHPHEMDVCWPPAPTGCLSSHSRVGCLMATHPYHTSHGHLSPWAIPGSPIPMGHPTFTKPYGMSRGHPILRDIQWPLIPLRCPVDTCPYGTSHDHLSSWDVPLSSIPMGCLVATRPYRMSCGYPTLWDVPWSAAPMACPVVTHPHSSPGSCTRSHHCCGTGTPRGSDWGCAGWPQPGAGQVSPCAQSR